MILGHHTVSRIKSTFFKFCMRNYSSLSANANVKKSVYVSQSKDFYDNLALEDWIYSNLNLTNHHVLLFWRSNNVVDSDEYSKPCLNMDIDVTNKKSAWMLPRNNYEESVNLNITFFTSLADYNNSYSLEIIKRALFYRHCLNYFKLSLENVKMCEATEGYPNVYHNYFLQVNNGSKEEFHYKEKRKLSSEILMSSIGWEYLRTQGNCLIDRGEEWANKQNGFHMVNPSEEWFPGITAIKEDLKFWERRCIKNSF